ncbi:MAG: GNAT family N-acetyltransferase [Ruminococcaceae bacterium]|nr:GNAT family N-acetyltransferase [Oscillospiraceae bacterium]
MNIPINLKNTILTTDRLILRPWTWDDLDDFHAYASVDGVGQMAGWNPHRSRDESRTILTKFIEHGNVFAIEHREDRRVIGSLGFHTARWEHLPSGENPYADLRTVEIGYVLSKSYWGQGLMPEAVRRVQAYLFEELSADMVFVCHYNFNRQSRRVIEKCGFEFLCEEEHTAKQLGKTFPATQYCMRSEKYFGQNREKGAARSAVQHQSSKI